MTNPSSSERRVSQRRLIRVDITTYSPIVAPSTHPLLPNRAENLRKPLSVLAVLGFAVALVLFAPPPEAQARATRILAAVGHLLVIAAALGRVWCAIYISGRKNAELCSDGPYAWSRNPLYFFSWLGVCGLMLVFRQPWLVLAASAAFAAIYVPVIRSEQRRLRTLFGSAYQHYCRNTPLFFPRWSREACSATREIRMRPMLRAITEVFWFLAAAMVAESLSASGWLHEAQHTLADLL